MRANEGAPHQGQIQIPPISSSRRQVMFRERVEYLWKARDDLQERQVPSKTVAPTTYQPGAEPTRMPRRGVTSLMTSQPGAGPRRMPSRSANKLENISTEEQPFRMPRPQGVDPRIYPVGEDHPRLPATSRPGAGPKAMQRFPKMLPGEQDSALTDCPVYRIPSTLPSRATCLTDHPQRVAWSGRIWRTEPQGA